MATYSSPAYSNNVPLASHGLGGNVKVARAQVSCTAAPTTSDTINFFYLPAGARVLLAVITASDMDSGTTLTLNVGDAGSATRLFSASNVGQAATESSAIAAAGTDYLYTAKTLITGVAQANATGGSAGTIDLVVFYQVEGQPS